MLVALRLAEDVGGGPDFVNGTPYDSQPLQGFKQHYDVAIDTVAAIIVGRDNISRILPDFLCQRRLNTMERLVRRLP